MRDNPVLISAPAVLAIPIEECGETLVSVIDLGMAVADDHPRVTSRDPRRFMCRVAAAERLVRAQSMLPRGIRLCIAESYRPLALQQRYWQRANARLRGAHPSWSDDDVADEAAKYVAPPWITPPHSTGGAIDVVLIDDGRELDMGCPLNEQCSEMMTRADGLSSDASANRQVLVDAMTSAGFVNYDHEWWHYSFGDRYWAYATNTPAALYGGI